MTDRWSKATGPSPQHVALIATSALLMRGLLFVVVSLATGATLLDYAESADGAQYLVAAKAWIAGADVLAAVPAARRFFPGVPMLTAALWSAGVAPAWAALLPSWLASAAAAGLAALWTRDARVGWAMAMVPPIYLYASSLISTETLAVALSLIGVVACSRNHTLAAGVALGLAALCRPFAVFAAIGIAAGLATQKRWADVLRLTLAAGLMGALGLVAVQLRFGDALLSVHTYRELHGGILAWPFELLVATPLRTSVPLWKVPYVWLHALVAAVGLTLAIRRVRRTMDPATRSEAVMVAVWLGGLLAFVVCLASPWAFHDFPRFLVPALPPLFFSLQRYLPKSPLAWAFIGAVSLCLAAQPATRNVRPELGPGSSIEGLWQPHR